LKAKNNPGEGFVVSRNLGLVDILEINIFKLKPDTVYRVYLGDQKEATAALKTNPKGMAAVSTVGPIRGIRPTADKANTDAATIYVMEGEAKPSREGAVLVGP
jgi:hypothetical protein